VLLRGWVLNKRGWEMSWLFINEDDGGTYAEEGSPDPQQIVSVEELQAKIDDLQTKIDSIVAVVPPIGAGEDLSTLIDDVNIALGFYLAEFEMEQLEFINLKTMLEAL